MNKTEAFGYVRQMAVAGRRLVDKNVKAQRIAETALRIFTQDVEKRRQKLAARRILQRSAVMRQESTEHMTEELRRILPCPACGICAGNPLLGCTGAFGCSLDRLRYRSCEVNPKPQTDH